MYSIFDCGIFLLFNLYKYGKYVILLFGLFGLFKFLIGLSSMLNSKTDTDLLNIRDNVSRV